VTSVAALLVVALILGATDWSASLEALRHASLLLVVLTGVVTLLSAILKGIRWWVFLRRSTALDVRHVVSLTLVGSGLNSALVANAGDVARVGLAARQARVPVISVLGALAGDKVSDVAAFATMCLVLLIVHPPSSGARGVVGIVGLCVMGMTLLIVGSRTAPGVGALGEGRTRGRLGPGVDYVTRLLSLARAHLRGVDGVLAYALSLLSWAAQVATYWMGALAVHLNLPFTAAVTAVVLVNLAAVLRATPGNVGVFQAMYVVALEPFGVPAAPALSAAIAVQVAQLLSSLIAGAVALPVLGRVQVRPAES
jgi:uncharacterized membrane protein YbhN (UPF0104 family)